MRDNDNTDDPGREPDFCFGAEAVTWRQCADDWSVQRRAFLSRFGLGSAAAAVVMGGGSVSAAPTSASNKVTSGGGLTDVVEVHTPTIRNSELLRISADVAGAFQRSLLCVAASSRHSSPPRGTAESIYQKLIDGRPPTQRKRLHRRAGSLLSSPEAIQRKMFGRHGTIPPSRLLATGARRLIHEIGPPPVDRERLRKAIPAPAPAEKLEAQDLPTPDRRARRRFAATAGGSKSGFIDSTVLEIKQIDCIDETGSNIGHDNIYIGGVAVSANGNSHPTASFQVSGHFDSGESVVYEPPRALHFFDLSNSVPYPRHYAVTFALSEIDAGGFANFLQKLWDEISDAVLDAVSQALQAPLAVLGPILSKAIRDAIVFIIDEVVSFLINSIMDDVFAPTTAHLTNHGPEARFRVGGEWGYLHSKWYTGDYYGYGGHYRVTWRWRHVLS